MGSGGTNEVCHQTVTLTSAGSGEGQPDRPLVGRVGRCSGAVLVVGRERALHLVDDEAWDAGQALDENDPRVDGADLFRQLSLAVRGYLSAEHDQVDLSSHRTGR